MTSTIDIIPHEQRLYLLWLADGPQPATAHHPDLNSTEADTARRSLLGRAMIHATQGGFWRLTDAGREWVEDQRS
jgi:hypothetical protein